MSRVADRPAADFTRHDVRTEIQRDHGQLLFSKVIIVVITPLPRRRAHVGVHNNNITCVYYNFTDVKTVPIEIIASYDGRRENNNNNNNNIIERKKKNTLCVGRRLTRCNAAVAAGGVREIKKKKNKIKKEKKKNLSHIGSGAH